MLTRLMNSYGKTRHFWHTGRHDGEGMPGHVLPMGDPLLVWSINRDGELDPGLKAAPQPPPGVREQETG